MREQKSVFDEHRQLALRMAAAGRIQRAMRKVLAQRRTKKLQRQEKLKAPVLNLKERCNLSDQAVQ